MLKSGMKVKLNEKHYNGYFKDCIGEVFTVDRVITEKHQDTKITVLEIDELHLIGAHWFIEQKEVTSVE